VGSDGNLESADLGVGSKPLPQARPQQIAKSEQSPANQAASAETDSATAAPASAGDEKQADAAPDRQKDEQPSHLTAAAETTKTQPPKRGLLPRLFASAPAEPPAQEQAASSESK